MKLAARICGVLSVLFLGACIVACGRSSARPASKDKTKTSAKTESRKTGEQKTSKTRAEKTTVNKKTQ